MLGRSFLGGSICSPGVGEGRQPQGEALKCKEQRSCDRQEELLAGLVPGSVCCTSPSPQHTDWAPPQDKMLVQTSWGRL